MSGDGAERKRTRRRQHLDLRTATSGSDLHGESRREISRSPGRSSEGSGAGRRTLGAADILGRDDDDDDDDDDVGEEAGSSRGGVKQGGLKQGGVKQGGVKQGGEKVGDVSDDNGVDDAEEDLWLSEAHRHSYRNHRGPRAQIGRRGLRRGPGKEIVVSADDNVHERQSVALIPRRHYSRASSAAAASSPWRRHRTGTPRHSCSRASSATTTPTTAVHHPRVIADPGDIFFSPTDVNTSTISLSDPIHGDNKDVHDSLTPTQERYDAGGSPAADANPKREVKLMLKPEQVDRLVRALAECPLVSNHVSRQWFDDASEAATVYSVVDETPSLTSGSSSGEGSSSSSAQLDRSSGQHPSPSMTKAMLEDDFTNLYPSSPRDGELPQFSNIIIVDPTVHGSPLRFTSTSTSNQSGPQPHQPGHCTFHTIPYGTTTHAHLRIDPASHQSINKPIKLQILTQILTRKSGKKTHLLALELDVTEPFIRAALREFSLHSGLSLDDIEIIAPSAGAMEKEDQDWCARASALQSSLHLTNVVSRAAESLAGLKAESCTMQTLTLLSSLSRLKTRYQDFFVLRPTGWHPNGMVAGVSMPWISQHLDQLLHDDHEGEDGDGRGEGGGSARLLRQRVVAAVTTGCAGTEEFERRIVWGGRIRRVSCSPLYEGLDGGRERPGAWVAFLGGESDYAPFEV
ncbi:hypothetical protein LTR62_007044 [Meristemomyces frigidus]|uniref:Uncharacterized protein n=1 Tax=Meristemomyces frigidus TaxID=1508187 RepID=A0AAN7TC76_9PEZI|nr:hypothetical protein LTR62_007044 [Meristemomyces frigidus]